MNIFTALAVLFVGLKVTHLIDWSWWWVTSPLWGGVLLIGSLLFLKERLKNR